MKLALLISLSRKTWFVALCLGTASLFTLNPSYAAFPMNWTEHTAATGLVTGDIGLWGPYIRCNRGGPEYNCDLWTSGRDPDRTPFLQERVMGSDGNMYYHVIVGDPNAVDAQGRKFAMEYYMNASASGKTQDCVIAGTASCTGPKWYGTMTGSASWGSLGTFAAETTDSKYTQDPLTVAYGGIGTGNPRFLTMRMIVSDNEMQQEFLKDSPNKPKVTQTITTAGLNAQFVMDLRAINYDTMTTPYTGMVNTMSVTDATTGDIFNFDMATATSGGGSHITAGQYKYVKGDYLTSYLRENGLWKYNDPAGGFGGQVETRRQSSTVSESGYNLNIDWLFYRDPTQNNNAGKNIKYQ